MLLVEGWFWELEALAYKLDRAMQNGEWAKPDEAPPAPAMETQAQINAYGQSGVGDEPPFLPIELGEDEDLPW